MINTLWIGTLTSSLSFWDRTSGTWMNVATVLLGTILGLLLKGRLLIAFLQIISQSVGLITLFIGWSMAGSLSKVQAGRVDGIILVGVTSARALSPPACSFVWGR
jgi:hypothetical protein